MAVCRGDRRLAGWRCLEALAGTSSPTGRSRAATSARSGRSRVRRRGRPSTARLVGTPTAPEGGWLVLNKGLQDFQFGADLKCAAGCKAGVLVRARKQADGSLSGIFIPYGEGETGLFTVTIDASGRETSRAPLTGGGIGSMVRYAPPPPDPNAPARGGRRRGGAARPVRPAAGAPAAGAPAPVRRRASWSGRRARGGAGGGPGRRRTRARCRLHPERVERHRRHRRRQHAAQADGHQRADVAGRRHEQLRGDRAVRRRHGRSALSRRVLPGRGLEALSRREDVTELHRAPHQPVLLCLLGRGCRHEPRRPHGLRLGAVHLLRPGLHDGPRVLCGRDAQPVDGLSVDDRHQRSVAARRRQLGRVRRGLHGRRLARCAARQHLRQRACT